MIPCKHTYIFRGTLGAGTTNVAIPLEAGDFREFRAELDVTAVSGTSPSLAAKIQDNLRDPALDKWNDLVAFSAASSVSRQVVNYTGPFADHLRLNFTVTGTSPSFTVVVTIRFEGF